MSEEQFITHVVIAIIGISIPVIGVCYMAYIRYKAYVDRKKIVKELYNEKERKNGKSKHGGARGVY